MKLFTSILAVLLAVACKTKGNGGKKVRTEEAKGDIVSTTINDTDRF